MKEGVRNGMPHSKFHTKRKNCQLAIALMDELMDEHARSIEQQTRGEKEKCLRPGAREALVGNE